VLLLDESSTFILPVARAVGSSLHTLAAVDGSSIALLLAGESSSAPPERRGRRSAVESHGMRKRLSDDPSDDPERTSPWTPC